MTHYDYSETWKLHYKDKTCSKHFVTYHLAYFKSLYLQQNVFACVCKYAYFVLRHSVLYLRFTFRLLIDL